MNADHPVNFFSKWLRPLAGSSFPLLLILLFLSGCSVEKRVYRQGYHITWNRQAPERENITTAPENEKPADGIITENAGNSILPAIPEKPQTVRKATPDSCGDIITMRNGSSVSARVIEVSPGEVKYKRCDNMEGPTYTINKNQMASIAYRNGVKEVFEQKAEEPKQSKNTDAVPAKKDDALAEQNAKISKIAGVICLVFSALFIISAVLSVIAFSGLGIVEYFGFLLFAVALLSLIADLISSIIALVGSGVAKRNDTSGDPKIKKQWRFGRIAGFAGLGVLVLAIVTALIIVFGII
ncbi:MAG: hypothetical protein ACJ77K_13725 [Bacteroidia bacterium]